MTDELAATEADLKTLFSLAAAALPAAPALSWDEYRSGARARTGRWQGMRRPVRGGVAAIAVLGLACAETGIAAAAGVFTGPTPREVWGAALDLTLTATWSQPTEVTRVVAPGPDGTTLYVGSSSVPQGTCEALAVSVPGTAKPTIVGYSCQGSAHTSSTPQVGSTYSESTAEWTSPTGAQYAMSYGKAPSGTASVALVSASGTHLVTGTASGGWYAMAMPAAAFAHGSVVTFYGATGASLGIRPAPTSSRNAPGQSVSTTTSVRPTKGTGGVAPMYAVGYAGIKFTKTGEAILKLENGRSITVPAHVAVQILKGRAESGTPPLPLSGTVPPTVPATS